jgi:hypothetical protein
MMIDLPKAAKLALEQLSNRPGRSPITKTMILRFREEY